MVCCRLIRWSQAARTKSVSQRCELSGEITGAILITAQLDGGVAVIRPSTSTYRVKEPRGNTCLRKLRRERDPRRPVDGLTQLFSVTVLSASSVFVLRDVPHLESL